MTKQLFMEDAYRKSAPGTVLRVTEEGGLVLGRDMELIYKQTSGILPTLFPALDSIAEDVFAAGGELTRLLLRRIDGASAQDLQTLAEPQPQWRS